MSISIPTTTLEHSPLKIQKPAFSLQSLSQDDLMNIIKVQGKIIGMGKWEINALIETFQKKNILRKAYHILLEYSQLHNDIHKLILKRKSYMQKILSFLKTQKQEERERGGSSLSSAEVGHLASKLAEYSIKAWIAICRWRQLQWSPRPILFSPPNSEGREKSEAVNVIKLFQNDADAIFTLSSRHGIHLIDAGVKPVHLITILVASAANVLSDTAIANAILRTPEVDSCEWAMENPADSHTQREVGILLSPYSEFISSLREVAEIELSFDNVWQTFSSFKGTNKKNQSQNLPILKLHYSTLTTDAGVQDTSRKYYDACEVLLNFLVRNFSVVPVSKKRGAGGDLHTSVLKSLANINGDAALISSSPPTVSPTNVDNYSNSNNVAPAHSQFTASSPIRVQEKTRPQSSPLIRSPHPQSGRSDVGKGGVVSQQEQEQEQELEQSFQENKEALKSRDHSRIRSTSDPVRVNKKMQSPPKVKLDTLDDIVEIKIDENKEKDISLKEGIPGVTLSDNVLAKKNEPCAPASLSEGASVSAFSKQTVDETKSLSVQFDNTNNRDSGSISDILKKSGAGEDQPVMAEVGLVANIAGHLLLTLERVEIVDKQQGGGYRLVVADFQAFCPAETMRAVDIGDEVVSVAGVSVEGKKADDVVAACKYAHNKSPENANSVRSIAAGAVMVTLRKSYVGREAVLIHLKGVSSAEQQAIMAIPDGDIPALEAALQRLKEESSHLEQCMEAVGQEGFHNARHQIMKNFGLMKTVQYKLSNALSDTVRAQKLEVERLEDQKQESLRQEAQRQEDLKRDALRDEFTTSSANGRGRTSTMDILEEEKLDSLSCQRKKKKKNKRSIRRGSAENHQSSQYFDPHLRNRPLIASLHFDKHWCSDSFVDKDNNALVEKDRFAHGVINLREKQQDSNSNSTMYNYAKARAVSNTIKHALRRVEVKGKGESRPVLAARKLCSWWGLIYPQKVLTMRMQIKTMVLDIVEDMVVRSFQIGVASTKRRMVMLKMAAATLIQQTFRKWKRTVLMHVIKIQKFRKRYLTRIKVLKFVNTVRAAVLVARYLYRRKIRLKKFVGKRVHYRRVIRNFLDNIGYSKRDANQKEIMDLVHVGRNSKLVASFADSRQGYMMQRRIDACIKIQSFFRMVAAQWYHKYLVQEDYICKKVRCAMKILQLRRKILNKRKLRVAAVKLQRTWRGCASRWKLFLQVIAGIKITAAWRKYRQYWKLKQCLRRIEFPVEIVLHGIRNIASQLIYSKKIKVRVSVWWNSLLHLVDNKDFMTITQSKQPHIIRTTGFYDCEQMPEVIAPPLEVVALKKMAATPPPVTAVKPRGGKRLSLMAQAQKINVGDSGKTEENSLAAFVNRQSQNAARQTQEKKAAVSLKGIVKKSMLTSLAITPISGRDSDEESESSSDSSSSSSCSDESNQSDDDFFDDSIKNGSKAGGFGGRNSGLGSNLLGDSPSQMSLPPLTLPPGFSAAAHSNPTDPPLRRTTMMRVSGGSLNPDGSQKAKKSLSGTVNLINKGLFGFSNAFKHSQMKKKEDDKITSPKASNIYQCNLNEETLYIPGCHGNAVIRFDLFDGDRKFGSNLFQLSEDKKLLFWGGEFNRDVTVTKIRRAVQLGNNNIRQTERSRLVKQEENPILDVRVVSGAALRSKCGWALVSIRGMGPIKRQRRAKGGFTKIFDDWDRGYLSMDGVNIYCYASKNAPNPWITIPLSDIKSIHIELNALSKGGDNNKKKSAPTEDKFDVVVTSSSRDIFHFKFPGSSARENWVRIIVDAVDYSRESLRTRLNLKQISGKSEKHMGIF